MVVSRVIDTALIMAAVYLALSLVVSSIHEQIAALFQWRGKKLYSGVLNLLSGCGGLTEAIFQHPLIAAAQDDSDGKVKTTEKYRPSYIGPRDFSLALWQSIGTATKVNGKATISFTLNQALTAPPTLLETLQSQVALVPEPNLRASLYALLSQAQGDYEKLLESTDAWFNRQMDRVAGWYRRKSQYVVIMIAVAFIALLGVDSIRIVTNLYADDQLRAKLAESIATTIPTAAPATSAPKTQNAGPGTVSISPKPLPSATPLLTPDQQKKLLTVLDDPSFVKVFVSGPIFYEFTGTHLLGVLLTIIALSLGAPFWFDALRFIMNCRLAGPKPSTTPSGQQPSSPQ